VSDDASAAGIPQATRLVIATAEESLDAAPWQRITRERHAKNVEK
jgi:hypothetical protein